MAYPKENKLDSTDFLKAKIKSMIPTSFKGKLIGQLNSVEEYERIPVPARKWKGWAGFIGLYAAEHTAGTEFVIGPLFVAHGVTASALIWGLLIGNLLAVLSWAFICAPIATRFRITLYYLVEKICGIRLSAVYNVVNCLVFCFLAAAMVTVSATAIGMPLQMKMPSLNDWLPSSFGWVFVIFIIGLVTTCVAMFGYSKVSQFSNVIFPWKMLVFIAAAINVLPELGVQSLNDFSEVANNKIWTGKTLPGQTKFTFWHIMFFSWFVNIAMHIGMADMSILRYAKKWYYGFSPTLGMYIGHFLAWIASGILYALFLQQTQYSTEFAPGPIAYRAAGIVGIMAVFIAGLTTANPTIYRSGLALQSVFPNWRTWQVTIIVGGIVTSIAVFPAIVMKFLELLIFFGILVMPMGAIILMDVYVLPKLGLQSNYSEVYNKKINAAAAITWVVTLIFCALFYFVFELEIFFVGLPGWFIASLLYVSLSYLIQRKDKKYANENSYS